MSQNLIYLSSEISDGWQGDYDVGYTIHGGAVYPQGAVMTPGAPPGSGHLSGPVGSAFFTGLPVAMRPAADTAVTLYQCWSDSIPTSGDDVFPTSIATTVHTDGTWTFDSLPGDIAAGTLDGGFTLSGCSWPAVAGGTDTIPWISFAPYVNLSDFVDIDSMIALHNNRVHLKGTVQAVVDGAQTISIVTPHIYLPTVDETDPTNTDGFGVHGFQALSRFSAPYGTGDLQAFGSSVGSGSPVLLELLVQPVPPGSGFWPYINNGDVVDLAASDAGGWASRFTPPSGVMCIT